MKAKKSLERSRSIPAAMKKKIMPFVVSSSKYSNKMMFGLKMPPAVKRKTRKSQYCSFGADKDGFFVYTHRARSKSKKDFNKITKKEIKFIESTG